MSVIDISTQLARGPRSRVYRVGVELEGGWIKVPDGVQIIRDSSVHLVPPPMPDDIAIAPDRVRTIWAKKHIPQHVGELPSPPLEPQHIPTWLRTNYPPCHNETCGMHVHMSFRNALTYQRLMVEDFQDTMLEFLGRWATANLPADHHIWPRLRGDVEYCQKKFYADAQASMRNKDYDHHRPGCRYTAIHYAYSRIGTIECRVLPMMPTVDLAISAVKEVEKITTAFLVATAARELPIEASWIVREPSINEEYVECV